MSCCSQATAPVLAHGTAAGQAEPNHDEERVRAAARVMDDGVLRSEFHVPGMHCIACLRNIERQMSELPYVDNVRANLSTKRVTIDWRSEAGSGAALNAALDKMGYRPALVQSGVLSEDPQDATHRQLLICLGVAGFAMANIMLLSVSVWSGADAETRQLFHLISGLIAVPAAAYAGRPFFASALGALSHGRLNMDVPISLAVILALSMSIVESLSGGAEAYFDAAVMLLFFLLIGRTLDHMMRERARHAVKLLAGLAAKGAVRVKPDGTQEYVDAEDIRTGDRVFVAAGERIPVDGVICRGRSELDRALVTGEAASVAVGQGDSVEAGTINLTGPIEIDATKPAAQSFLAEIVAMMSAAENGKARFVRIADRAARIYAPTVHILALATFIGWMIVTGGDWKTAGYIAIAALIITCPCALGLAVPIVHVIGAGRLFEHGILMKDGSAFEKLNQIDTVIFDKTGTLTVGRPRVVGANAGEAQVVLARLMAANSRHPAAQAIAKGMAGDAGAEPSIAALCDIHEVPGSGVEATMDGRRVRLGRLRWVAEIANEKEPPIEPDGMAVWLAEEGRALAYFALADALRPDAEETIERLQRSGIQVEVLSGDRKSVVEALATTLGITDAYGEMTPGEKIEYINDQQRMGRHVLMVGDGLNDAPALAAAHVSMAPSSASDVGRQAADFVFTGEALSAVTIARDIAKRTDQLVRQNLWLAVLYNFIAVPIAVFGYVTPLVAAIAMSLSSIVVVGNSMRLRAEASENRRLRQAPATSRPIGTQSGQGPHSPRGDFGIAASKLEVPS